MKVSLNWLSDYVEINHSAKEIAETLSDLGLPYEGIEQLEDDWVIDVEVTSNRGDCLSHIGIARELAAATGKDLKIPKLAPDECEKKVNDLVKVEIAQPDLCGRYTARVIEAVSVAPSPAWMQKRLQAVGMRSVNNVVDATNYAMMETGQPPHAFDYDKIAGGKIVVRRAAAGERITSIDGSKRNLAPDMLIIADTEKPVAIAGVMGSLDTEVSNSTTTILLEDAYFDPVTVRTTSRRLMLPSEAAFRFERNVDIEMIDWASLRTAQLIVQVAGGKIAKGVVDAYPQKPAKKIITLRLARMKKLLGINIPVQDVLRILVALQFEPQLKSNEIISIVPSCRSDIYREVDLIEEVSRVYGYDKITTEQKINIRVAGVDKRHSFVKKIGSYLNSCGFYETINVSFVDEQTAKPFAASTQQNYLKVKDEARKSANLLRQSLIGSLLQVLKLNYNMKNIPCSIFELANTYVPLKQGENHLPREQTSLSLVCDSDFRELRGVIEGLVNYINQDAAAFFRPVELPWAKAGAEIIAKDKIIGCAGMLSQETLKEFDLKDVNPSAAELDFSSLLELQAGPLKIKPIPRFPEITRDLSIIVDEQSRWSDIAFAIERKSSRELEKVQFVGVYRGKPVPEGRKSVTLSLHFRDEDGTLTHEKVDELEKAIVEELTQSLRAELRKI